MDAYNHHHHHHHRQQNKLHNYITWSKKGNEGQSFLWGFFFCGKKKKTTTMTCTNTDGVQKKM